MTLVNTAASKESLDIYISSIGLLAEGFDNAEIRVEERSTIIWPDLPLFFYNNIMLQGSFDEGAELASEVSNAAAFARTKAHPGIIVICHGFLTGSAQREVGAILASEGFNPVLGVTGMEGDLFPITSPGHPDLRIERAPDDGRIILDINCVASGIPVEIGRASLAPPSVWKNAFAYVGYEGDRPVSTAVNLVVDNCLYLFSVATVPDARGKGYADAVIRHSLQEAHKATGIRRCFLHASEAGCSIYKRIGYLPIGNFTFYSNFRSL